MLIPPRVYNQRKENGWKKRGEGRIVDGRERSVPSSLQEEVIRLTFIAFVVAFTIVVVYAYLV